MPEQITLTVTVAEVNGILQSLGQMPYAQVFSLIEKLKVQAEKQVNPAPEVELQNTKTVLVQLTRDSMESKCQKK